MFLLELEQVGAQTETELKEKKLRVEDALNATKVCILFSVESVSNLVLHRWLGLRNPLYPLECVRLLLRRALLLVEDALFLGWHQRLMPSRILLMMMSKRLETSKYFVICAHTVYARPFLLLFNSLYYDELAGWCRHC